MSIPCTQNHEDKKRVIYNNIFTDLTEKTKNIQPVPQH